MEHECINGSEYLKLAKDSVWCLKVKATIA